MNTDTPMTDDESIIQDHKTPMGKHYTYECVDADFARTLERENAKLKEENANLHKLVGWSDGKVDVEELLKERDQWREVADSLCVRLGSPMRFLYFEDREAILAYEKLKGEK
jgi:hypothetical protein